MLWHKFIQFYFHLPVTVRLLLSVSILMIMFGSMIHLIEPIHFPTVFDGIWWAIVTGSTVGYGDYVPLSAIGKVIAILLILAGGGFVTFYMATLSASTIKYEQDLSEGKNQYTGTNHTIIIGWNERTRQLIEMFKDHNIEMDIVLIDHSTQKIAYRQHRLHFISGEPTSDHALQQANIKHAKHVIITADPTLTEEEADRQTILSIIANRGNHASIHIIAEILTETQKKNAVRAGANVLVRSNNFMSSLFFQSLFQKDLQVTDIIANTLTEQQFCYEVIDDDLIGKNFFFCAQQMLHKRKWLIGMMRNEEMFLHPDFTLELKKGDSLIYLKPVNQIQLK
ncbi:potassium channel family protein [Gracilibacillus sp. S3-1-1]|uniref:Potassium channel family protein n=1 Tax=Gracilibacillus pellucidus TaxID=3095368 RepID=A0ACC6M1F9_9BACI|nr:potassium channel family protein [Gracilibacillus sp. S3-1-1]MDX8044785.1 potassium channel family protein [Gracilibacillus sp. S3-1-1]